VAPLGDDVCSPVIRLRTPSPAISGGRAVRGRFVLRATALGGGIDKDRFVTVCE
jgi:hypothetical protein